MPLQVVKPGVEFVLSNAGDESQHQTLVFAHTEYQPGPDGKNVKVDVDGITTADLVDLIEARVRFQGGETPIGEMTSSIDNIKALRGWLGLAAQKGVKGL